VAELPNVFSPAFLKSLQLQLMANSCLIITEKASASPFPSEVSPSWLGFPAGVGWMRRILLVDDDPAVLRAYASALARRGWDAQPAADGRQAVLQLHPGRFEAIVSDIAMPEMDGVEFLRAVREQDLDIPVVLMTGAPELDSAMRAVEFGAFRYLEKPVSAELLDATLQSAVRLHDLARLKREAIEIVGVEHRRLGDRAGLEARFAMALKLLYVVFQPIVSLRGRKVFGFEALMRSYEPTLPSPADVLVGAERLGRVHELGRVIRARIAEEAVSAPAEAKIFVNLHPLDLNDEDLYRRESGLAAIASRVVLEVTERAPLDGVKDVAERLKELREMGFQIAVDDLGAGYAGLTSYARLEPEIAKIDMSLVRNVDSDARKRRIVGAMRKLCEELGTNVVAEGVETPAERDALAALGFDLLQGYLFGTPERGFPLPCW
jgi:EAL domain-containing protein (putative c-di-GMP-specific phosphodiesterase class I)/CheY-like chemotaxis protein